MDHRKKIYTAALFSFLLGWIVILGWAVDIALLKSILPGFASMKANSAVCFILAGTSLYLITIKRYLILANVFALIIISIAVLTIAEYVTNIDIGIDNFVFLDSVGPNPGRMASATAICFVLLAFAFVLIIQKKAAVASQFILHGVSLISFIAIVGYILQVAPLYKLASITSMAVHTSVAFFIVSVAASLVNPNLGITGLFTGERIGNKMARNLFPKMLVAIVVLTFLRIESHRVGIIDVEFGIALFALSFILVGLLLIRNSAKALNKIDLEKELAQNELIFTNQNLESIVNQRTEDLRGMVSMLEETSERNKIFIKQAPNAIAMFDNEVRYLAASEKWIKDYGLSGMEIIGRSHYEIFPEIGDDWKAIHQSCLKGAVNQCDEAPFKRKDGSTQWLTWDVRPWFIAENEIGGILMYTSDITLLKAKDADKRRIEEILDKTNEVARIGTWEVDLTSKKISWSRVTREIHEVGTDYEPDLKNAIDFFKEGLSRQLITNAVEKAIKTGASYDLELEIVTAKGKVIWVRAIGQAEFKDGVCQRLYGIFQDINEVKKSRESLFLVNEELNTIFNAGYVSIIGTDVNGLITHFSKGAELQLQYKASEMVGIHSPAIIHLEEEIFERGNELSAIYGRDIQGFDAFVELAKNGEHESREWTYVRKDGTQFPVQLVITAIKDQHGSISGFLGIATDVSDLEKAKSDLQVLTDRLQKQNKQLLSFAHITSHNLRSPVSNLNTVLYLYKETEDEEERKALCGHMETVVHHLTDTLDQLVDSLKIQEDKTKEREWLKFEEIFTKTKEIFVGAIMEANAIVTADFSEAENVEYPRSYLESIMLNLLSNALKYRSPHRIPKIDFKSSNTKNGICLTVSDNGLGIDLKKHGDKLFGLNKTFHRHSDAKGVGLFMTKIQVEAMGGSIEALSEVDKGTTFRISFKLNN